jgi:hypothetical protein
MIAATIRINIKDIVKIAAISIIFVIISSGAINFDNIIDKPKDIIIQ